MKLQVKEHTRQPRSVLSRSPPESGIRKSFPFLVTACPRFRWGILERARCVAFGLIFGFQVIVHPHPRQEPFYNSIAT